MKKLVRRTKRLTIRPLEMSDFTVWKEAYANVTPAKNRWELKRKSAEDLTIEAFRRILKSQKALRDKDSFYDFAVFENASGKLVGTVSVMDVLRGLGHSAYIGYFLLNPFWGKGYGKEATLSLIDIAFKDIKLHRIEAGIEPENRRSIMLARSLGLRKEGLKKRAVFLRGSWVDLAIYSATCEEFGVKWKGLPLTRPR